MPAAPAQGSGVCDNMITSQDRTILKHPRYAGHMSELIKLGRTFRKPLLSEINFTKQLKTTVVCTHCWGRKAQANVFPNGMVVNSVCAICNGSGVMEIDNRPENFDFEVRERIRSLPH